MAIGVITLHTATFEAKFVTKVVNIIIKNIIRKFGNELKFFKSCPIFPFKSEYSFFAASERAKPPPL